MIARQAIGKFLPASPLVHAGVGGGTAQMPGGGEVAVHANRRPNEVGMPCAGFAIRKEITGAQLQTAHPELSSAGESGDRECRIVEALRSRNEQTLSLIFGH